jgi:AcrR family transcriptional regulator
MAVPYQETGRRRQKARTRDALLAATRSLLAAGVTPTVAEAAERASVSRTTAYRYFPTQEALHVAAYPEIALDSVLGADPPVDLGARFDIVFAEMARQVLENEAPLRAMLRLSLEVPSERGRLVLRRGRRRVWVEDALGPLRPGMPSAAFERLVLAVTVATGIEAFVWLTDIAGRSRDEALDVMRFSAETLLAAASRPDAVERNDADVHHDP